MISRRCLHSHPATLSRILHGPLIREKYKKFEVFKHLKKKTLFVAPCALYVCTVMASPAAVFDKGDSRKLYALEHKIAAGAYGVVYAAKHKSTHGIISAL